jgi:DNA-binding LytR/AlgR family response regulator
MNVPSEAKCAKEPRKKGDEMRAAIVEDDRNFAEQVKGEVSAFFQKRQKIVEVQCLAAKELLEALGRHERFGVCLLDVEMPGMDGVELARQIHALDASARVIFLTAYDRYALKGFQTGVYYYILKDGYQEELGRILERICREEEEREEKERKEEYYIISGKEEGCKLAVDDILYLIKAKKYTCFYCRNGEVYKERISINSAGSRLPSERFLAVSRGVLANKKHIKRFADMEIIMCDGTLLFVSRRMWKQVRDRVREYWGMQQ